MIQKILYISISISNLLFTYLISLEKSKGREQHVIVRVRRRDHACMPVPACMDRLCHKLTKILVKYLNFSPEKLRNYISLSA